MKKLTHVRWLGAVVVAVMCQGWLGAAINFSSKGSGITVHDGAKLNAKRLVVGSPTAPGGTINVAELGTLVGEIAFSQGVLNTAFGLYGDLEITGSYTAEGTDSISLADGVIMASGRGVMPAVNILPGLTGTSRIEGDPFASGPITLQDSTTTLELGIEGVLDQPIHLNGGTLSLRNNLNLAGAGKIVGPGTVKANGYQIQIGAFAGWGDLSFVGDTFIRVVGEGLALTGTWSFSLGVTEISGNGNVLALENGNLTIGEAYVHLIGLEVSGVKNGSLSLQGQTSGLGLSHVNLWFFSNMTFNTGYIIVAQECTWLLQGYNIKFTNNQAQSGQGTGASLLIGDILNVVASTTAEGLASPKVGTLAASTPFFVGGVLNSSAIDACIASGVMYLFPQVSGDPFGFITTSNANGSVAMQTLTQTGAGAGAVSGQKILLDKTQITVTHTRPITIPKGVTNVLLDGNGGSIYFASPVGALDGLGASTPAAPLFIVPAGASITLKNIRLQNVTQDTFSVANATGSLPAGKINFAENVTLDLGEDVILTQGLFSIVPATVKGNPPSVLLVRGVNGRKALTLKPTNQTSHILDLRNNSLMLQDIELIGTQFLGISAPTLANPTSASVVLAGNACVDVGPRLVGGQAPINVNFDVEGVGNELVLTQDGLTLGGTIAFPGIAAENALRIRFLIPQALTSARQAPAAVTSSISRSNVIPDGLPYVVLAGSPGIQLAGNLTAGSFASLEFTNPKAVIINVHANSFTVDNASILGASGLQVMGRAIKEIGSQSLFTLMGSAPSIVSPAVAGASAIDNSAATKGLEREPGQPHTAFSLIRSRQLQERLAQGKPAASGGMSGAMVGSGKVSQQTLEGAAQKIKEKTKLQTRGLEGDAWYAALAGPRE